MKTEMQKCLNGELFNCANEESLSFIKNSRKLTQRYNSTTFEEAELKQEILKELLGKVGENVLIDVPFYCDYGKHISIGDNVIVGINCTFVDCNKITIGNKVMIASNVQICTATHPVASEDRLPKDWTPDSGVPFFTTYAEPVTIGDNVWIGAGATILPGVEIGENCVIGAGSVVTKSIPSNSLAVGVPAKVIKSI